MAPIGVFGSVAYTTAKFGLDSLLQLGYLVLLFYATCILFVVIILGSILKLTGLNIFKFVCYFKDELAIVLGTASSDSVLPQIMKKLKNLGIKDSTVGLVIPTGYSFNLDGFSIYLTLGVIFIAQYAISISPCTTYWLFYWFRLLHRKAHTAFRGQP